MGGLSYLKSLLISTITIFFSFCCNEQDKISIEKSASAFGIKQAEASFVQSNQNFMKSFKVGDSFAVASCYTSDAKAIAPGIPSIKGRENITHFIKGSFKKGFKNYSLSTTNIWDASTVVTEEGTYELADSSGKKIDKGKYIVLRKRVTGKCFGIFGPAIILIRFL